ncbi:TauD/TfdA family dioxygenase [Altererythrobacter arenosus]|uniref:TauD/TfdA family dioxygenase n=1 Tax=Altererythrobacter arenosus TaxID=3032592 RepID=A0ABY8FTS2_9SPHN|nr:TauD/TfdA family dioxygenase [Altererythrobacter sp. CAU 1644]WFL77343.1 TauD/TfdA family dioxygenase [Altererythrobacter sp. CAU 1644]
MSEPDALDPLNHQRLYEPNDLPDDLRVIEIGGEDSFTVQFSDGYSGHFDPLRLLVECGWEDDPERTPTPVAWTNASGEIPSAHFDEIDGADGMRTLLEGFFTRGFCIIRGTPHEAGDLDALAQRFGYIRETNWGRLFDVYSKPVATDLAYTGLALAAHTDNPYRFPVPGIQFLHCLENSVAGGFSTVVDGLALVERIAEIAPDEARALEELPVRFRYDTSSCIVEDASPLVERDNLGRLIGLRLSSRLDYVLPAAPEQLDLFYAGRRRLQRMANDPQFQLSFPFEPGLLLMMDNRRTLHGRTAFDGTSGKRHLQGCYIDHDGPRSLWRTLMRDGVASLGREAA